MLYQTDEGRKGLRALYDAYTTHFGCGAAALAEKFGYTICPEDVHVFQGQLVTEEGRIIVSKKASAETSDFTTFHEMAHHFTHGVAPIFSVKMLPGDVADDIEYWCDHFALAMFFAERGVRLMEESNYDAFLTQDNENAYNGRDMVTPWRQSRLISKLAKTLAAKHFGRKSAEFKNCKVLSDEMLAASKLMRELDW